MNDYSARLNGSAMPLNQSMMDQSVLGDYRQPDQRQQIQGSYSRQELLASPQQAEIQPLAPVENKPAEIPKAGPGNGLILNFGPDATQDPIYRFKDNSIRTTKYTAATWAPKSLILQFRRVANIYFLVITILTCLSFSPKKPASQIMTFAMVLFFTMLKEGYEDMQRFKQDKEANNIPATVYNYQTKRFEARRSKDIQVGDLLRIQQDEVIAADVLIIKTSAESGVAFVNTMNLDGETNLKEKICLKQMMEWSDGEIFSKRGKIRCDSPNEYLESWEGSLNDNRQQYSCNIKQLGLRGTTLKNTKYVYGIAVYTGHNTKIMKNAKNPPSKVSGVLHRMNQILTTVFIFQALVNFTFAAASVGWTGKNASIHTYLHLNADVTFGNYIVQYLTFLVAYSHLIPISLYVALELLKLMQGTLMKWDQDMYYAPMDKYVNVKASDLVEEIGQVEMIFSDKTGTLTANEMEFKKCSINLKVYGENFNPDQGAELYNVNGDPRAFHILASPYATPDKKAVLDFFTLLAVCHTVMPEFDPIKNKLKYQASSPDELALVEGALKMGFEFLERTASAVKIRLPTGELQAWEIFSEFPFDSTRKRMSLIVKRYGTEQYYIMTKGADSIMFPRLTIDSQTSAIVQDHLDKFAIEGLRTLVVAQKPLDANQVRDLLYCIENVKASNAPDKEDQLNALYDIYEKELALVGCTAIEDKLQEGVPETIATLMEAGIRIWVLTGDKQETAIEIAKSCKLIQPEMQTVILSANSSEEFFKLLNDNARKYRVMLEGKIPPLDTLTKQLEKKITIVINGSTLVWALETSPEVRNKFFRLALLANSVVCCRVSPKQKADVVHLAKSMGPWTTLSIGDGANDVPMIMEAHVGVGIYGKEGTQAARTADFALGQFCYLKKLLLYHGRVAYRRVSLFILYYFYKNVIVVFTEIYFAFYNGFSGQIYWAEWLPMLYNSVWTTWPPLFSFVLDRDVPKEYSYRYPKLYQAGPKDYYFNLKVFWKWMAFSAWHGLICYFLPVTGLSGVNASSGIVQSHWWISTVSFSLIMSIVTIKLFVETIFWNWYNTTISIASIFVYYISLVILCTNGLAKLVQPQLNGILGSILGSPRMDCADLYTMGRNWA